MVIIVHVSINWIHCGSCTLIHYNGIPISQVKFLEIEDLPEWSLTPITRYTCL